MRFLRLKRSGRASHSQHSCLEIKFLQAKETYHHAMFPHCTTHNIVTPTTLISASALHEYKRMASYICFAACNNASQRRTTRGFPR